MPRLGTRELTIEAGLHVAEYGLEHLTYTNVAAHLGMTIQAVRHHWCYRGGTPALRAAVIELATRRRNHFVVGQLRFMRPLPDDGRL